MVRTQIQLTERQSRELKRRARQHGISEAEYVRRALDSSFEQESAPTQEELVQRALSAIGCAHSGLGDVSERHDDYLEEAYAHWESS